jgi:hypothetical protein
MYAHLLYHFIIIKGILEYINKVWSVALVNGLRYLKSLFIIDIARILRIQFRVVKRKDEELT